MGSSVGKYLFSSRDREMSSGRQSYVRREAEGSAVGDSGMCSGTAGCAVGDNGMCSGRPVADPRVTVPRKARVYGLESGGRVYKR